jgi:hypothetical protein
MGTAHWFSLRGGDSNNMVRQEPERQGHLTSRIKAGRDPANISGILAGFIASVTAADV